jgi:hypothetical protein
MEMLMQAVCLTFTGALKLDESLISVFELFRDEKEVKRWGNRWVER